jgi:hypothetical protein
MPFEKHKEHGVVFSDSKSFYNYQYFMTILLILKYADLE